MPLIQPSSYQAPPLFSNPHLQTIWHSEFRRPPRVTYSRERIDTPDGDCLCIDWLKNGGSRAALLLHGLESSSDRPYMRGMAAALHARGFDCAALNFRGCGGELNRTGVFYNAGMTDDLHTASQHLVGLGYAEIVLCGFSLGGNVVLKYAGERGRALSPAITRCAAVSAPVDLVSASASLERRSNFFYNRRFVRKLYRKACDTMAAQPGTIDTAGFARVRCLRDYDEQYTAPMGGYSSSMHYYEAASSRSYISSIAVPVLLINAQDDPFLGPGCYPLSEARSSGNFFFECPPHGGHIGFILFGDKQEYWHETRVADFLTGR